MMMVVVVVVGGEGGGLSREKSRDVLEQPPPILAKARRLQLADASFRDYAGLQGHFPHGECASTVADRDHVTRGN